MPIMIPEEYRLCRVMSIDPGLNNIGICFIDLDLNTRSIKDITAWTLNNDRLNNHTYFVEESHSERLTKLFKLRDAITYLLQNFNPAIVISESPFYNPARPSAYGSLVESINVIQTAVTDYNYNIMFRTVEPLLIKKVVGAKLSSDKDSVKKALQSISSIVSASRSNLDELDQHSIDAIAVGYTFLTNLGVCQR
jgi:Holliday junction resolvasome RuvABC endonuclease subunit